MAENTAGLLAETIGGARLAQSVGAYDTNAPGTHVAQAFTEACQAIECMALAGGIQPVVPVQTCSESHALPQAVHDDELAVREPRDHHVETVGAEIYGAEHLGIAHRPDTSPGHGEPVIWR
ncbi:MAG: hypothetical protein AMXMBFR8_01860 [Nevskiales bacterium]